MRAVIFANGDILDYKTISTTMDDYVICCDGAVRHIQALNIIPNLILGDFDSCDPSSLELYKFAGSVIKKFSKYKDKTDMELALLEACSLRPDEIVIYGALGTRFDHNIANMHLLKIPNDQGISASIVNEKNMIFLVSRKIFINADHNAYVTLLPLTTTVTGVNTSGLAYPLSDATLNIGSTFGVSNFVVDYVAEISIGSGLLFVIVASD